jgi:acetate kinase
MKILVINAGSSSLKYQLIDMETEKVMAKGICDRIGAEGSLIQYKTSDGRSKKKTTEIRNHVDAFKLVTDALVDREMGVISSLSEIAAIGHRIVQGGSIFDKSVLVNDEVIRQIQSLIPLAPLHNGPEVDAILASREVFGKDMPQCVVFDTSFHATMPPKAYLYAIPYEYYEKYKVRRYGFHGTSHRYVSHHCAHLMHQPLEDIKMITCHIGKRFFHCRNSERQSHRHQHGPHSVGRLHDGNALRNTGPVRGYFSDGKRGPDSAADERDSK